MRIKRISFGLILLLIPVSSFAAEVKLTQIIKLGINYEVSGLPDVNEERIIGMEPINHIGLYLNYKKDHQLWAKTPWGNAEARYHFNKGKHQITVNVSAEEGATPRVEIYVDGVSLPILREPKTDIGIPKDVTGDWVEGTLVNMKKISICENCTFTAEQIKQFNK